MALGCRYFIETLAYVLHEPEFAWYRMEQFICYVVHADNYNIAILLTILTNRRMFLHRNIRRTSLAKCECAERWS